ncbi:hypothetical protein [Amycolatopsis sp. cg9]|uniref:hypothetical protein n=1 Tax=Amycolatopsis sp. cg9 TaxID=3238801 RepID=UPI0035260B79
MRILPALTAIAAMVLLPLPGATTAQADPADTPWSTTADTPWAAPQDTPWSGGTSADTPW